MKADRAILALFLLQPRRTFLSIEQIMARLDISRLSAARSLQQYFKMEIVCRAEFQDGARKPVTHYGYRLTRVGNGYARRLLGVQEAKSVKKDAGDREQEEDRPNGVD